ncbi:T-cell surface glycoprotein CD3 epsilon chain-like [Brienomyrus brachyistius]|uniref:T-cell surface glycoprotein CD3 epsilon chain-like n=1 Tax=Brienomyrus brachyistius TaxID=42636 RepID=UPI0020B38279|nr:T-cell surface glycoprotein CD3 epsilon chain-like [Brienomyrus brachyistius]XP_048837338.1 T-cell surface glycoprotein CD3 epsilon chain-like [Brienomyrus brachyistius]XP_048837339.1 T-cell surface glycoprotein CD3 epsilon chain-like [Brienomyrus brachyistius]
MMRVVFFVFFSLAVMADEGEIKVNSRAVTLTCPGDTSEWGQRSQRIINSSRYYTFIYEEDTNGVFYYCMYDSKKYSFYFKGKVCEDCFQLDGILLLTIISGDLLVTGGVILFAYHRAQRKLEPPPAAAANHQSASREPESDYEDLSPRTRDNATYAGVQRTG